MLLEEFDANQTAVINPGDCVPAEEKENYPKIAVSCFSWVTYDRMCERLRAKPVSVIHTANLDIPVSVAYNRGLSVAFFNSYVGAAGCVGVLEEIFARGVETVILFGTCGVLDASIRDCSVIVPTAALRDEGTSYHYALPADEIEVNSVYTDLFLDILKETGCSCTRGKVWTTDGSYRETREKVARRREAGAVCVDMECAAVAACAQFRGKRVFQFFYAADNLAAETWDARSLSNHAKLDEKDRVASLALMLARRIAEGEGLRTE